MSVVIPKADVGWNGRHVGFVPIADISSRYSYWSELVFEGYNDHVIIAGCQQSGLPVQLLKVWSEQFFMSHIGGCSCGAVRFDVERYLYVLACHCSACRKRTGSAYGLSVVVEKETVKEFRGTTKTFTRKAESGRKVDYEFCPNCGTTIRWGVATMPERQVFAGGTFAEIKDFIVVGEMYTDHAIPWARLGCELSRSGEADNEFRKAMIEKTRSAR